MNTTIKLSFALLFLSFSFTSTMASNTKTKELPSSKMKKARIKTVHGDIIFKFRSDIAPVTSSRIKKLIRDKFYNGIKFHRVIPGFVAQAGDPSGTGSGGSGQKLKAEFSKEKHRPGIIAMARKGDDINSADSQFYITLGTPSHLDGQYTIFAELVGDSLKIANKIQQGDKIIQMSLEK